MKISQREWMFLGGGVLLGYLIVPQILHHSTTSSSPSGVLDDAGAPCPKNQIVRAAAGNYFCCPFVPGPDGSCNP
jgi:hypothetical protein